MKKLKNAAEFTWDMFLGLCEMLIAEEAVICYAFFVFIAVIILGGRQFDHHYEVNKCHGFGQQTNREVKWADYSFWNYECLTPTHDGKWIPTDKLREY